MTGKVDELVAPDLARDQQQIHGQPPADSTGCVVGVGLLAVTSTVTDLGTDQFGRLRPAARHEPPAGPDDADHQRVDIAEHRKRQRVERGGADACGERCASQRSAEQSELGVGAEPSGNEGCDERHQKVGGQRHDSDQPELDRRLQPLVVENEHEVFGQVRAAAMAEPRRLMHEPLDLWVVVQAGLYGVVAGAGSEERGRAC